MTGQELRNIRQALGWTQSHLAARLKVRQNTIARWEAGKVQWKGGREIPETIAEMVRLINQIEEARKNLSSSP